MKTLKILAAGALFAAAASCGGSNVQYFQVAVQQSSGFTGTDCPGVGNDILTYTGIDGVGTWAVYTAPPAPNGSNTQYLLDQGSGTLLVGTLSGGTYTFASSVIVANTVGSVTTTVTIKNAVSLTPGAQMTGTIATEEICTSSDDMHCGTAEVTAACGAANGACGPSPSGSADNGGFDCTSTASFVATQITNVSAIHPVSAAGSLGPSASAGGGGGGKGAGTPTGGGNAGSCMLSQGNLSDCTDYVGSAYTPSQVQGLCSSGTYSAGACAPGSAGSCDVGSGSSTETVTYFGGGFTSAEAQSACSSEGGTYSA